MIFALAASQSGGRVTLCCTLHVHVSPYETGAEHADQIPGSRVRSALSGSEVSAEALFHNSPSEPSLRPNSPVYGNMQKHTSEFDVSVHVFQLRYVVFTSGSSPICVGKRQVLLHIVKVRRSVPNNRFAIDKTPQCRCLRQHTGK